MIANGLEPAAAIAYLSFLLLTVALFTVGRRLESGRRLFLLVVWLAAVAHLAVGQVGWLNRYEHYMMVMIGAALIVALPAMGSRFKGVLAVAALMFSIWYGWVNVHIFSWNPRAIHLQQAEMARFVETLPGEAVAANDIGWLSWRHEAYVLDLWGLASAEARKARTGGGGVPAPEWAARLIAAKGVRYAMIYDRWIGEGVGAAWRKVAELTMDNPRGALGGFKVSVYATDPAFEPALRAALREFRPRLSAGAVLTETD